MNDRFKFRVYSHNEKKMYSWNDCVKKQNFIYGMFVDHRILGKGCFTVMQSTGLKDKNGKLIYEGDILKVENGGYPKKSYIKQAVVWDRKRYVLAQPRKCKCTPKERQQCIHCENNPIRKEWFFQTCSPNFKDFYNGEVIGNIYENQELLEETK